MVMATSFDLLVILINIGFHKIYLEPTVWRYFGGSDVWCFT